MELENLRKKFPNGVLREKHPYYMADAIADIPGCLADCLKVDLQDRIRKSLNGFRPERIFTIGCGTSFNACQLAAYYLQNLLRIPVIASDAFDFEMDMPPGVDEHSIVIGISESGQSITTCLSLERSRELGAFTVGISANSESRLSKSARLSLTDPCKREIPLGKTRTYLSTALLAMLSGIHTLDQELAAKSIHQINGMVSTLQKNLFELEKSAKSVAKTIKSSQTRYIITGFGAQKANADETRLKILEILGESATSFGLEEFTHGPSASFKNDLVVIMLQTDDRTLEKAVRIAQGVVFSNTHLIIITDHSDAGWPKNANLIKIPFVENQNVLGQFSSAVAAQYLFYNIALNKGLNPDVNLEDTHPELGDIYAFFFPPGTH
jgi:glutamine---fructose-6-phosphate transaminase (isomerizing)